MSNSNFEESWTDHLPDALDYMSDKHPDGLNAFIEDIDKQLQSTDNPAAWRAAAVHYARQAHGQLQAWNEERGFAENMHEDGWEALALLKEQIDARAKEAQDLTNSAEAIRERLNRHHPHLGYKNVDSLDEL